MNHHHQLRLSKQPLCYFASGNNIAIEINRRHQKKPSIGNMSTMNHLARRFTSSGGLSIKNVRSLAATNSSAGGFPLSFEKADTQQYRNFSSILSNQNTFSQNGIQSAASEITSQLSFLSIGRYSSTDTTAPDKKDESADTDSQEELQQQVLSPTSPTVFTDDESGEKYGIILDTRKLPKLKPSVVRRRLANCRTYEGRERSIRQSPWKLNRVCQLAAGLTLEEALTQLKFCDLKNADLVAKVLKRTSNLADIRDGLQISQLEVKECFATKSLMLRRIKPMGRGR